MARPRKHERRTRQMNIKLTESEEAWVKRRARANEQRPGEFGRAQLLAEREVRRKTRENAADLDPLFLSQLSRVGNNLNQLTRRFNQVDVPPPPTLEPLLQLVRDLLRK